MIINLFTVVCSLFKINSVAMSVFFHGRAKNAVTYVFIHLKCMREANFLTTYEKCFSYERLPF